MTLEQRIQKIEDRLALQDLIADYLSAVDNLTDLDDVLNCFTDDAVFDMTAISYPRFEGIAALTEFFTNVFSGMKHSAHYATNFKLDLLEQDRASARTHALGVGVPHEGDSVTFYVQYVLEFARTGTGWKIKSFYCQPLIL